MVDKKTTMLFAKGQIASSITSIVCESHRSMTMAANFQSETTSFCSSFSFSRSVMNFTSLTMGFLFNSKLLETGLNLMETKGILKEHFWSDHEYYIQYVTTFRYCKYCKYFFHLWMFCSSRLILKQAALILQTDFSCIWFVLYFDTSADGLFTFKILL